ncbi:ABC transporter substrate-binding protein [Humibacter ginsenosidimutans]|uniref:Sugar ABC transporter substrate-binding protein n=1 Tax=Humibacter ginsenosidimutans TaxID=2599293 RepID=A0A5B8M7Z3_9MICO|nr:sugar ABC transporter substrate-binding protein [Humibacter ginsenosidimutans]QDZ16341.1 sugar ABC transporter substrate-binding protein [Humibacter ginsenosidimutans]
MTRRTRSLLGAVAAVTVAAAALTGCSSGNNSTDSASSGGVVHLTFTNWDNGMQTLVNTWNKENPKIQVKLIKPSGTGYTLYNKLITDNSAGTNPDLTEVEYQALPMMVSNKVVVPIDKYVTNLSNFSKSTLSQVQFEGKTYGVPQNVCPLVFFYRKDLLAKDGITTPPATWDEFAKDAAIVHKANPKQYLMNFDASSPEWFAGLAQQAGANWWTTSGDTWSVNIDDAATQKVASYWQNLLDQGVIAPGPSWSTQWNTDMNSGNILGWVSGQWAPNQLPTIAPDTAGDWVAAPVPAWTAGDQTIGTWGGEVEAVTANSKHPAEAAKFANWMNNTKEGINLLIKNVQVFPAAQKYQSLPALQTPPPFMKNQPDYNTLMKQLASNVRGFDIWGPNANITFNSYSDAFGKAVQNHTSFVDALKTVQTDTVSDMKKTGYKVK